MKTEDRQRVQREYDDELDPHEQAQLDARAAEDPAVAAYRASMHALRADLRALAAEPARPPRLDLDALARSAPPRRRAPVAVWSIAAAAAALLAVGAWWALGGSSGAEGRRESTPAVAHAFPSTVPAAPDAPAAPELGAPAAPADRAQDLALQFPSTVPATPGDAPTESPATAAPEAISFRIDAPDAARVTVAGDFNGWQPEALTMTRAPDGAWLARASLPPGRYAYMYIVDGQWTTPPDAARTQDDGFGSQNAIIDIL
jgi:hypothetical protein